LLAYDGPSAPQVVGTASALLFFSGGLGITHSFQGVKDSCVKCQDNPDLKRGLLCCAKTLKEAYIYRYLHFTIKVISEFSACNAIVLARVSSLAYKPPSMIMDMTTRVWGLPHAKTFYGPKTNTKAIVMSAADFVIIGFKGTEKNLHDLATDLNIRRFKPKEYRFRVHMGFKRAVSEVYVQVLDCIRAIEQADGRKKKYLVTGHSLGGALATLFVARYLLCGKARGSPDDIAAVYTYGSPKVGDKTFATVYDSLMKTKTFRIVNHKDVITTVPPLSFKHVGTKVLLDHDGQIHMGAPSLKHMGTELRDQMKVAATKTHRLFSVAEHYLTNYIYMLFKHKIARLTQKQQQLQLPGPIAQPVPTLPQQPQQQQQQLQFSLLQSQSKPQQQSLLPLQQQVHPEQQQPQQLQHQQEVGKSPQQDSHHTQYSTLLPM